MWTAAGLNPSVCLPALGDCPASPPGNGTPAGHALTGTPGMPREVCVLRPAAPLALTQQLVEDVGDRVIPAALEEGQASWGHGVLVFLVEIKSVEGPLGKLVAVGGGEHLRVVGGGGTRAPHPTSGPIGNAEKPLRVCLAQHNYPSARLKAQVTREET